jgi:hypothetical protein
VFFGEAMDFWAGIKTAYPVSDSALLLMLRDGKHLNRAGARAGEHCAKAIAELSEGATPAHKADLDDLARALRSMCLTIDNGKASPAKLAQAIREVL